jgi:hypothetical protein
MNKELIKINDKIQAGEIVNSADLNRLWNYYRGNENNLKLCVYWSNGFYYKLCWFSWEVLE